MEVNMNSIERIDMNSSGTHGEFRQHLLVDSPVYRGKIKGDAS